MNGELESRGSQPVSIKLRVFVSSVIQGFEPCREAAREAIADTGGEPVLVNEQSPALNASSRSACLDAVGSCDLFVLLIGARGGWRTPSGQLVVEEELAEAVRRKLPVFVFIQSVQRDQDAQQLVQKLSDYVSGYFRVEFNTPAHLQGEVARALRPHLESPAQEFMSIDPIAPHLEHPHQFHDQTSLRLAVAPERAEEVFDPVALHSEDFQHRILELGHKREIALFRYQSAKEPADFRADELVIKQPLGDDWRQGREGVRLGICVSGLILMDANVTGRSERENSYSMADIFTISTDTIDALLRSQFRFVHALYEEIDPHKRYGRFLWNAALTGLGHRSFVRGPQQEKHSYSMNMSNAEEPLVAHAAPRLLSRADLASPAKEIERAILYWSQQRNGNR